MPVTPYRTSLTASKVDTFKPWIVLVCCLPFLRWIYLGLTGDLTANPTEFLTRSSGTWALVGLLLTLTVTPLQVVLRQPALVRIRRTLGLATFTYALLHMLAWAWWDQSLNLASMWADVLERPFVAFGFSAFVLLFALALTSNQWAMRTLKRRWKRLHQLIYLITLAVLVHYWLHKAGKNDFSEVLVYVPIAGILLGWRLTRWLRQVRARRIHARVQA